jgi:transcriptional regulator with PAS, ATPase and Fis domain
MDRTIYDILNQLPRNVTLEELENYYIIVALDRNNANRCMTCKEIEVSIRKLRYKIKALHEAGYSVKCNLPYTKNTD